MFDIHEVIGNACPPLHIVDVGAASMGEGTDPYHALLSAPNVSVIGFEPNQAACDALNARTALNRKFLPYAIGDGQKRLFFECRNPLHSSLYEPNEKLFSLLWHEDLTVLRTREIQTLRLDDLPEIMDCDLLKIDVQGAELDVLNGATRLLRQIVVIHTEVEFVPAYKGQPLFGQVDQKLVDAGFLLHNFTGLCIHQSRLLPQGKFRGHQLLWSEGAIYLSNFMLLNELSAEKLLKLAYIAHLQYGSYDIAALALQNHDKSEGGDFYQRYVERFNEAMSPPNA